LTASTEKQKKKLQKRTKNLIRLYTQLVDTMPNLIELKKAKLREF
jgi:hypothetical protein